MNIERSDEEAAMEGVHRRELVSLMEPLTIAEGSPHRAGLTDLAFDLAQKAAGFRRTSRPACSPPSRPSCGQ
jgi:hypothetical protein